MKKCVEFDMKDRELPTKGQTLRFNRETAEAKRMSHHLLGPVATPPMSILAQNYAAQIERSYQPKSAGALSR